MLRAITFDLWETLIHEVPESEQLRRDYRVHEASRVLAEHGIEVDLKALEQAHRNVIPRMDPFWGANLDVSVLEQTRLFLELATGFQVDGRLSGPALMEIARHYGEAALRYPPIAANGARSVLASMRVLGLRTGLLCNTGRTPGKVLREVLGQLELKPYFDVLCFSDEVRLRKPAIDFFMRALTRLNVRPQETVHVGDMPETDLAGAKAVGMRTIHVRRTGAPEPPPGLADFTITAIAQLPEIVAKLSTQLATDNSTPPPPGYFGKETTQF